MPWRLIAKAFGWRAATDEDGNRPSSSSGIRGSSGISAEMTPGSAPCGSPSTLRSPPPSSPNSGQAKEDDFMIEPMQQRMLQARMETAEGDTRRRLRIIERQIVSRAERMTVTEPVKRR